MAFLAVSAPLNHCRTQNEKLHERCRKELLSKPLFQGNPLKKTSHHHLHFHHPQQQQDTTIFASVSFPSFPNKQSSGGSSLSASILTPSSSSSSSTVGREVYQPFRPPPRVIPTLENLSIEDQLQILRERQGLWFEYAVHVPSLIRAGLTPSMIDEATGVTGVEQNKIVVAAQVRSSLQASGMDESMLSFYDIGGADLLYELRIISTQKRKAAAIFALERKMDAKEYRELARAVKDYERRKREEGWESFSFTPGDCLAYSLYRLSKEVKDDDAERVRILEKGLEYAETEKGKAKLRAFLEKGEAYVQDEEAKSDRLQVIRLTSTEAGTPSIPFVLPVVEPIVQEFEASPAVSRKGPFTVQYADNPWNRWVSLPAWEPLTKAEAPVAISLPNAALLPWKQKMTELKEPLLIVADKHAKGPHEDAYYLVESGDGKMVLQLGTVASETGSRVLGKVVLALRPPLPEEDDADSIEWD